MKSEVGESGVVILGRDSKTPDTRLLTSAIVGERMARIIAHIDMDGFFASCEEVCNPALKRVPLAVCSGNERGVVTAANRIAKVRYGIKTGMSGWEARRILDGVPGAVLIAGDPDKYVWFSRRLNAIARDWTPAIEPYSIDELFLDLTGCPGADDLEAVGLAIKGRIREELGLFSTIGFGPNRFLAKMGTEAGKPDGLVVMTVERFREHFWGKPPSSLWGIGARGEEALRRLGIGTVGELARYPIDVLRSWFGKRGAQYGMMANGIDDSIVGEGSDEPNKSFSNSHTLDHDTDDPAAVDRLLFALCDKVSRRMRAESYACRTVGLWLRASDFGTFGHQVRLPDPTNEDVEIYQATAAILQAMAHDGLVRAAGVWCGDLLHPYRMVQGKFDRDPRGARALRAVDRVRDKYGDGVATRALLGRRFDPMKSIHFQTARRFSGETGR